MSNATMEVSWDPAAKVLLQKRDRYTREAIQVEFADNPIKDAIEFDMQQHYYVTPVANKRYTVVWKMSDGLNKKTAKVHAVVPTQFLGNDIDRIRNEVKFAVNKESKGTIKLF